MLRHLSVEALATVEKLEWEPGPGFSVVSGETGAGKSVLVGAVALLLGARAGAEVVRTGAGVARVDGVFDWSRLPSVAADLAALGVKDPRRVALRRELGADGRSRFQLDGRAITAAQARDLGRRTLDLHGQHEHQSLLRTEAHLLLLDRFGRHEAELAEEARRLAARDAALAAVKQFRHEAATAAERRELWQFQARELEEARLADPGEDAALEGERLRLAHSERIREALQAATQALEDEDAGALLRLREARHALARALEWDATLREELEAIESAEASLSDGLRGMAGKADRLDVDPGRLRDVEDRLEVLRRIKKRHGGSLVAAIALAAELRDRLRHLEDPAAAERQLERAARETSKDWREARRGLHRARVEAAARLVEALAREWREVGLPGARFEVELGSEPEDLEADWPHAAEFYLSTNPGEDLRPLARVASGGEMSRLLLGIKSVLAEVDPVGTLVFDEVDAGIGGGMAQVIAARLCKLARARQVLCITHLPAIAAAAEHHFRVEKSVRAGRTCTRVVPLDSKGRVEELSRMLAGSKVSETTRRQARELLQNR